MCRRELQARAIAALIEEEVENYGKASVKWLVSDPDPEVLELAAERLRAGGHNWSKRVWHKVREQPRADRPWQTASTGPVVKARDEGFFILFADRREIAELAGSLTINQGQFVSSRGDDGHTEGFLSPSRLVERTSKFPQRYLEGHPLALATVLPAGVLYEVGQALLAWLERFGRHDDILPSWFGWLESIAERDERLVHDQRWLGLLPAASCEGRDYLQLEDEGEVSGEFTRLAEAVCWPRDPQKRYGKDMGLLDHIHLEQSRYLTGREREAGYSGQGNPEAWKAVRKYLADGVIGMQQEDGTTREEQINYLCRRHYPAIMRNWPEEAPLSKLFPGESEPSASVVNFALNPRNSVLTGPGGRPVAEFDKLEFSWSNDGQPGEAKVCIRLRGEDSDDIGQRSPPVAATAERLETFVKEERLGEWARPVVATLDAGPGLAVAQPDVELILIGKAGHLSGVPMLFVSDEDGKPTFAARGPGGKPLLEVTEDSTLELRVYGGSSEGEAPKLILSDGERTVPFSKTGSEANAEYRIQLSGHPDLADFLQEEGSEDSEQAILELAPSRRLDFVLRCTKESADDSQPKGLDTFAAADLLDSLYARTISSDEVMVLEGARLGRAKDDSIPLFVSVKSKDGTNAAEVTRRLLTGGSRVRMASEVFGRLKENLLLPPVWNDRDREFEEWTNEDVGNLLRQEAEDTYKHWENLLRATQSLCTALGDTHGFSEEFAIPSPISPWLDRDVVASYVTAWEKTVRSLRSAAHDRQSDEVADRLFRGAQSLALLGTIVLDHGQRLLMSPFHPIRLSWLSLSGRLGLDTSSLHKLNALGQLCPRDMPRFVTLPSRAGDSKKLRETISTNEGWTLYATYDALHPVASETTKELLSELGAVDEVDSLNSSQINKAVSDYHHSHPLRSRVTIRWPNAVRGKETWWGRKTGLLGRDAPKPESDQDQRERIKDELLCRLGFEIVAPPPENCGHWTASPEEWTSGAFPPNLVLGRETDPPSETNPPDETDLAFFTHRPDAAQPHSGSRFLGQLLANGLLLSPYRYVRFDGAQNQVEIVESTALEPLESGEGPDDDRGRMVAAIEAMQALDVQEAPEIPGNRLARYDKWTIHPRGDFSNKLRNAIDNSRWTFLRGSQIDPEYFDHLDDDEIYLVQYIPRLTWWRGSQNEQDSDHGLVAVTKRTEEMKTSLARQLKEEFADENTTEITLKDWSSTILKRLNRHAPGELAQIGYSSAHRRGAIGMAMVSLLFPQNVTKDTVRLLLPIDDYWDKLCGRSPHADFLDLAIRLPGPEDGKLILYCNVIEAKFRQAFSDAVLDTAVNSQVGNTWKELIRNQLESCEQAEQKISHYMRAANLLAMVDRSARAEIARAEREGTLGGEDARKLYNQIREHIAVGNYRFAPYARPAGAARAGSILWGLQDNDDQVRELELTKGERCEVGVVFAGRAEIDDLLNGDEEKTSEYRGRLFPGLPLQTETPESDDGSASGAENLGDGPPAEGAISEPGEDTAAAREPRALSPGDEARGEGGSEGATTFEKSDGAARPQAQGETPVDLRSESSVSNSRATETPHAGESASASAKASNGSSFPELATSELGTRWNGDSVYFEASSKTNPHILVAGLSGMGKTTCLVNILADFAKQGVVPFAVDFHGDLADNLRRQLGREIRVLEASSGLAFNPLALTPGQRREPKGWALHCYQLADMLCDIFPDFGDLQRSDLRGLLMRAYEEAGYPDPPEEALPPRFHRFYELLREACEDDERDGATRTRMAKIRARLEPFFDLQVFRDTEEDISFAAIQTSPTILELSSLMDAHTATATATFFLDRIYREMFRDGPVEGLRQVILFDEAHRASKIKLIRNFLKEGRKYGVAVLLASQSIGDFDREVFDQTGQFLAMRLGQGDLKKGAEMLGSDRTLQDELRDLAPYHALYRTAARKGYESIRLRGPGG